MSSNPYFSAYLWTAGVVALTILTVIGSILLIRKFRSKSAWTLCTGAIMLALGQSITALDNIVFRPHVPVVRDMDWANIVRISGITQGVAVSLWLFGGLIASVGLFLFAWFMPSNRHYSKATQS